jgi:toxin ParE1/3/4
MGTFRLTQLALEDLRSIGRYTELTWGREQRNRYLAKLDNGFHILAERHQRGRSCNNIRLSYRKYSIGRHLIFYRESQEGIEIIRVLHASMDVGSYFNE